MKLIYENALSCEEDIRDFTLEGSARLSFPEGKLRMENAISAEQVFCCTGKKRGGHL